jgi:hypothetical protein
MTVEKTGKYRWTIVAFWDDLWSPTPHRGGRAAALRDETRRVQWRPCLPRVRWQGSIYPVAMALPATMRRFDIALSDSDRDIYDTLELRVAQHPSESERYLVARVIARALEHAEGLEFSKGGVSDDTEPALVPTA